MIKIAIINDEVSNDLEETISFLRQQNISLIELRSVHNKNILDFSLREIESFAKLLKRNGIRVDTLASPLFKWFPDKATCPSNISSDLFHFNPNLTNEQKRNYILKAIKIAKVLETNKIRIFSLLRANKHDSLYSFSTNTLLCFALKQAEKANINLLLENEMTCIVRTKNDIFQITEVLHHHNFGLLLDLANLYKVGNHLSYQDLKRLKKCIKHIHLKDYRSKSKRYVPLGSGDINYQKFIGYIKELFADTEITLSLETHVKKLPKKAVWKSINNLRRFLVQ